MRHVSFVFDLVLKSFLYNVVIPLNPIQNHLILRSLTSISLNNRLTTTAKKDFTTFAINQYLDVHRN